MIRINSLPGFEHIKDYYYIANDGEVFSTRANRYLKGSYHSRQGDKKFVLVAEQGTSTVLAARLVATAYVVKLDDSHQEVGHADGNNTNNKAENLYWFSQKVRQGFTGTTKGHSFKFTVELSKDDVEFLGYNYKSLLRFTRERYQSREYKGLKWNRRGGIN